MVLYEVQSTKYQVWDCTSRVILLIHFETQLAFFKILCTLYLVHCTMYYFPNSILTELIQ